MKAEKATIIKNGNVNLESINVPDTIKPELKEVEVLVDPKDFNIENVEEKRVPIESIITYFEKEYLEITTAEYSDEIAERAVALRKKHVKVRNQAVSVFKGQKEYWLEGGRVVDKKRNDTVKQIEEREAKLLEIETTKQRLEMERINSMMAERKEVLKKFDIDADTIPEIRAMGDAMWKTYLIGVEANYKARKEAESKAEEEKKEREERQNKLFEIGLKFNGEGFIFKNDFGYIDIHHTDVLCWDKEKFQSELKKVTGLKQGWEKDQEVKDEQARIENEKLKKENEEKEKQLAEANKKKNEEIAKAKRIADEKLKKEKDERLKLEKELNDKKVAEQKAKDEEEARIEAEAKMGDKAKMDSLISSIEEIKTKFSFKSKANQKKFESVQVLLDKVIDYVKK